MSYFRRYTVDQQAVQSDKIKRKLEQIELKNGPNVRLKRESEEHEAEKEFVIKGCKPEDDLRDRRIFFELTGRKLHQNDFPAEDQTS